MSIEMFAGMITGVMAAAAVILFSARANRRRNPEAEDERMVLVKSQASTVALRIVGVMAFLGWVVDNLLAYSRGEAIQTITPWSIMLLALVAVYDLCLAYFLHKHGGAEASKKNIAATAMLAAATLLILLPQVAQGEPRGDAGLRYLMIGLVILQAGAVLWMLLKARHSFRSAGGGRA